MTELEQYGLSIRRLLQQKNMKAEELVDKINQFGVTTTNKVAISRIMTGKRMPSKTEAELLARVLETPPLFDAYLYLQEYVNTHDATSVLSFHESLDRLFHDDLTGGDVIAEPTIDYGLLYQMMTKLYRYCLFQDVASQVKEGFLSKLEQVRGLGEMIDRLKIMYQCFFYGKNLAAKDRAWLAVAILYFISPIDLIPDYLLPYGYIDDSVVVGFVFNKLSAFLADFKDNVDVR